MSYLVKELPIEERPRERLMKYGVSSLANYELLAIILRTGSKAQSVLDLAKEVLIEFQDLSNLFEATIPELKKIKGIGNAKAIEIIAAIELGKRINVPKTNDLSLKHPKDIYNYLKEEVQNEKQENLICVYLNAQSQIIDKKTISIGSTSTTIFNPKDILKWAIKLSAFAFVVTHNHPSGNPAPSEADIKMTRLLMKASDLVDVIFVDHVIIGKNRYFSMKEHQLI